MVSSLDSVRLWSSQTAMRIFKENDAQAAAKDDSGSSSLAQSLLSEYGMDSSGDDTTNSTYTLADLLAGDESSSTPVASQPEPVSNDIQSLSFMAGLKAKLEELAATPSTQAQAKSMLAALSAGTLTVTDVTQGQKIAAWDVDAKDAKAGSPVATPESEWSGFLRDNLVRESGGKYKLSSDGSYTDKATGDRAYFGMIGDNYYYLTWPAATASK